MVERPEGGEADRDPTDVRALTSYSGVDELGSRECSCALSFAARCGADMDAFALLPEQTQDLNRLVAGRTEPVRKSRIELGDLAGAKISRIWPDST
jgi:hypothetical protein